MLQVRSSITLVSFSLFFLIAHGHNVTSRCAQDFVTFLKELQKAKPEQYAVLMFDAFGKLGSDVEGGNVNRLGSIEECLSVKGSGFGGQYCQIFLKQGAVQYFVGICVPDSCDGDEVRTLMYILSEQDVSSVIAPVPHLFVSDPTLDVYTVECISNNMRADRAAVIGLCVCILMMALPLTASVYITVVNWLKKRRLRSSTDPINYGTLLGPANQSKECIPLQESCREQERKTTMMTALVQSLSVRCTGVFGRNGLGSGSSYPSLNGVRILSLFWIIFGHTLQLSVWSGLDNVKRWREAVEENPLYLVAYSGPVYLAVDTFLLLGGLLSAKSLLSSIQRSEDKLSLRLIAHFLCRRFKRIQPLHLFIVCVIVSLFFFAHKGSFWFITEDEILNCNKLWWSNLLLINNLFTITHTCAPWTWYLSIDFQFYITTPLLIFLYRLSKRAMVGVAAVLLVMSCVCGSLITGFLRLPVHQPTVLEYESYFQFYYNKPYTRYGPYLLGILSGIHMVTKKEAFIKRWWQAVAGWVVSLSIMAMTMGSAHVLRGQGSAGHAVYQGLHRSLWALAVAWVIVACEEGYGGFVNTFLSLPLWIPLSNISFACYLVHPVLILLYNGSQETPIHYTDLNFLYLFLAHSFLTVVLGFILTVLIEKPYQLLSKAKG